MKFYLPTKNFSLSSPTVPNSATPVDPSIKIENEMLITTKTAVWYSKIWWKQEEKKCYISLKKSHEEEKIGEVCTEVNEKEKW